MLQFVHHAAQFLQAYLDGGGMLFKARDPACWRLLRLALRIATDQGITQVTIIDESGAGITPSTLSRFIAGKSDSSITGAGSKLWDWSKDKGFLRQATKEIADETPDTLLAQALEVFYRTNPKQLEQLIALKAEGYYFGYKLAYRHPEFMVRSIWKLAAHGSEPYFIADEFQYSSGEYEADREAREEYSHGLAFSKSSKLWMIVREVDDEQPRTICLDRISKSSPRARAPKGSEPPMRISGMSGYGLEATRNAKHPVFHSPILLLRSEHQKALIADYKKEVDILPLTSWDAAADRFRIPHVTYKRIVAFLKHGAPFYDPSST